MYGMTVQTVDQMAGNKSILPKGEAIALDKSHSRYVVAITMDDVQEERMIRRTSAVGAEEKASREAAMFGTAPPTVIPRSRKAMRLGD